MGLELNSGLPKMFGSVLTMPVVGWLHALCFTTATRGQEGVAGGHRPPQIPRHVDVLRAGQREPWGPHVSALHMLPGHDGQVDGDQPGLVLHRVLGVVECVDVQATLSLHRLKVPGECR